MSAITLSIEERFDTSCSKQNKLQSKSNGGDLKRKWA